MISLIIPLYNEEQNIPHLIEELNSFIKESKNIYEIILVNDASSDKTLEMLNSNITENMQVVSYEKNMGKGFALRSGVKASSGEYVFFTDADLAYGLDIIETFFNELKNPSIDAVIGSRKMDEFGYKEYPLLRKIMSDTFIVTVRLILGMNYDDTQSGIKGFKGNLARDVFSKCNNNGFGIDFEVLYLLKGKNIKQLPVRILHHTSSSINPITDSIKTLKELFIVKRTHKKNK